ncbi:hypothetical protein AAC387_Pa06g3188 [Persea americana]
MVLSVVQPQQEASSSVIIPSVFASRYVRDSLPRCMKLSNNQDPISEKDMLMTRDRPCSRIVGGAYT